MAARAYFSHNEVHGKNTSQMQEMLFSVYGINWNDYPTACKRGACCVKGEKGWEIDTEIPIFKGEIVPTLKVVSILLKKKKMLK